MRPVRHLEIWARAAVSAVPYVGGPLDVVYSGYRDRAGARTADFLEPIAEQFRNPEALDAKLATSDHLDAIFGRAIRAAVESGLTQKRVALGRVVVAALTDDAVVDRAGLLVDTLAQVEAPHIRALAEIRQAVIAVKDAGQWPLRATGAEHEIISSVVQVGNQFEDPVIRTLRNLGLIFAGDLTDQWFVHDLTSFGYELLDFLVESSEDNGPD